MHTQTLRVNRALPSLRLDSDLFSVVYVETVEPVLHERRLTLQHHLVRRPTLHLAYRLRDTRRVLMSEERERHLFRVSRFKGSVQRQDVKHLK